MDTKLYFHAASTMLNIYGIERQTLHQCEPEQKVRIFKDIYSRHVLDILFDLLVDTCLEYLFQPAAGKAVQDHACLDTAAAALRSWTAPAAAALSGYCSRSAVRCSTSCCLFASHSGGS